MFLENANKKGWIEVVCGSMFSGKTEELIRRLKRAQFAHLKGEIFMPKVRADKAEPAKLLFATHDGDRHEVITRRSLVGLQPPQPKVIHPKGRYYITFGVNFYTIFQIFFFPRIMRL